MTVTLEHDRDPADTIVVEVSGDVDLGSAAHLWEQLDAAMSGDSARVVVDLTRVTFMDSSGLRVLIGTHKRLRSESRELVVRADQRAVLRLLEITGLDQVLTVETPSGAGASASA